jgi:predicted alpha/beta-hydrolase family hydrolase
VDMTPNSAYPQYPTGTPVRVRGQHVADRILVYQIDLRN